MKPSGIGGQAVIEGIMMRNKDVYSVAVRKPDNNIEVIKKESKLLTEKYKFLNFPIIRGVINFIDSLVTGTSTLTYSASFFEDPEEQEPTHLDHMAKAIFKERLDAVIMVVTVLVSIAFAMGLFMVLPFFASRMISKVIVSKEILNLIEGLIRVLIFIVYILLISLMNDIKRVYMYHGAEHKCINCIENGLELNIENVRKSSRHHKRCGTSFIFFVMFISVIFFIFIRVDNPLWQVGIRLVLVPVIAGVSYELIRWAGRSDNPFVVVVSKPGMWLQSLTTREPDDSMIEVAIKAVEEVFDWKTFQKGFEDNHKNQDEVEETEKGNLEYAVSNESKLDTGLDAVQEDSTEVQEDSTEVQEDSAEVQEDSTEVQEDLTEEVQEDIIDGISEENLDSDDGISFLDESDAEDEVLDEIPIFKQRKTDL